MNVKEAVQRAMAYVGDVFEKEGITNLGLEEIVFDSAAGEWVITIGFSRPWDYPKVSGIAVLANANTQPNRTYKVLRVDDEDGEVLSIRSRA